MRQQQEIAAAFRQLREQRQRMRERQAAINSALEPFRRTSDAIGNAINQWTAQVSRSLSPLVEAFGNAAQRIWAYCWQSYRTAGMPYGETDEGMMQWTQEQIAAQRLRETVQREIAWQRGLAEIRRIVKKEV